MLHIDLPTAEDIDQLARHRGSGSVSVYLATSPISKEAKQSRTELSNAVRDALDELEAQGHDKKELHAIREHSDELVDDDEFWPHLSNSLAVFITTDSIRTFRLPNHLESITSVADRFFIKPLLRAVAFPQAGFVLAVSQNAVRLVEITPDSPAFDVAVANLPKDAASSAGKSSLGDRSHSGRLHGSEGLKVRLHQYSRAIDRALRPVLTGQKLPLILAAAEPLASIYRSVNTYAGLTEATIEGNPETLSDGELAEAARTVLDGIYATELDEIRATFEERSSQGRAATDLSDLARAATFGAIDTLLVDIDGMVSGVIDEQSGALTLTEADDPNSYGVVDEIARRALASGARVVAVRSADVPGGGQAAALLRYAV